MTTRREFIKILTGTVIAISLPMGLPNGRLGEIYEDVEFTIQRVEIIRGWHFTDDGEKSLEFDSAIQCLAIPNNKKLSPCFATEKIENPDDYNKESIIKGIKDAIREHYIEELS